MPRLITVCIACLSMVSFCLPAFAGQYATVRVTRSTVVLDQPRNDSAIITTVSPGVVLDVFEQRGEWYLVALSDGVTRGTTPTGWIERQAVELLSGQGAAGGQQITTLRFGQGATGREVLQPGLFELMVEGSFIGATSGGETEATFRTDAMLGYFVTPVLEVGGITTITKLPGLKAVATAGGLFAFNIPTDSVVVPFVGTAAGAGIGFPATTGNPFWINFFGGFKLLMPGGGGALVVRPFFERQFYSDSLLVDDVNLFGVAVGASLLF